jgi:hypothetical protein
VSEHPVTGAVAAELDVLPIFYWREGDPEDTPDPVAFSGTGFRLTDDLLVTCWHCVEHDEPGHGYAVVVEEGDSYRAFTLHDVSQDANGSDLATARIHGIPAVRPVSLTLAEAAVPTGQDVWTYGYPLTAVFREPDGELRFTLHPRFLQGYVTRSFRNPHPRYGAVESYEVDMPAPEGLSGAPLVHLPSREVVGVIYGNVDAAVIDQFAAVDEETGERQPEIQRIVSFAVAHYTPTLLRLTGPATGGQPLHEYVRQVASGQRPGQSDEERANETGQALGPRDAA